MSLAAILLAIEAFRLRSLFIWLSVGAASSGILALLRIPLSGQIVVFINISGILILLERRFSEKYAFKQHSDRQVSSNGTESPKSGTLPIKSEGNPNVFRKSGDVWEIGYAGLSHTSKHSVGLVHIRNLLIKPGAWIHCSELKRISSENWRAAKHVPYGRMNGEQLELENLRLHTQLPPETLVDRLSLEKIRKLRDILKERKESDSFDSPEERIDQLNTLDFIEKYLESVTDKNGRPRKIFETEELDRKAVSIAISRSRNNLRKNQELFIHLKSFIQAEGNCFRYLPDRPIDWKTE